MAELTEHALENDRIFIPKPHRVRLLALCGKIRDGLLAHQQALEAKRPLSRATPLAPISQRTDDAGIPRTKQLSSGTQQKMEAIKR